MLARDLYNLLDNPDTEGALRKAIAPAMPAYRRDLAELGRKAPIDVTSDDSLLVIAAPHLTTLCEAFMAGQLDAEEIRYIATAFDVSPDFQFVTGKIEECATFLTRQESGGPSVAQIVQAVHRALREHVA